MLNGITLGIIIVFVLLFLCIILSVLVNALLSPLSKTPSNVLDEISDIMDVKKKDVFLDLGSGDGGLVFKVYSEAKCKCIGYEISPMLIMLSNMLKAVKFPTTKDITFEPQNIFRANMKDATKIYCYLDKNSMKILSPKLKEFLKRGGEVYSYMYGIEGVKNEKKVMLKNKKELYIYKK
jgi:hypothetical protein